jgi:hypothetical protein
VEKARLYALKASEVPATPYPGGHCIHRGNLILGHLALDSGDVDEAKRRLLAAAKSGGGPHLSSFGPNMALAKALLVKGEDETVLRYFELCAEFWTSKYLNEWIADVESGRMPDFGPNLIY